jgi:hypothetical protein
VSANSTVRWAQPNFGLDYYWVPGNILLFHVNYPYDFAFYGFALIGFGWVIYKLSKVCTWILENGDKNEKI